MSVDANILLNVYGMTPVNITLDICNFFGGALCPLPNYNFTGADIIPLPSSIGVSDHIPSIGFSVPDLEGYAQLTLIEVGTGEVKACVQATLSNGWSAHQTAVEWTTGGIAILFALLSIWASLSPRSLIPFRFLDLLHLFQSVASSALISVNHPSIYRSFALNFAWAIGLFSSSTSTIQESINKMRALTGGDMANSTSNSAVGFVNRKLSPFNTALVNNSSVSDSLLSNTFTALGGSDQVQTVTPVSSNVLQAGIPIYVNSIHVSSANAFMTAFFTALDLIAISIGLLLSLYIILRFIGPFISSKYPPHPRIRILQEHYIYFLQAWALRLVSASQFLARLFFHLAHGCV